MKQVIPLETRAPDCPGRSGAGKSRTPVPATKPALTMSAAEELDAVLHWRDKHTQAIREREALQQLMNAKDEWADLLEGLLREVVALDPRGEFLGWQLDGKIDAALKPTEVLQIAGFKVVEDPSIPPGQIRMCDCNQGRLPCTCKPSAYDGFDNGVD